MSVFKCFWPRSRAKKLGLFIATAAAFALSYNVARLGWSLVRWQAYIWAPAYWLTSDSDPEFPCSEKHLIFIMVDHYEHGKGEQAVESNRRWLDEFQKISDAHRDDYGNRFRYTWYYPFDHHDEAIMTSLSRMAYKGYGEVEMHWHLSSTSGVTRENFPQKLQDAIKWYQSFGAMVTTESPPRTAFSYVAGVWDLDAGRGGPNTHGITNQIETLFHSGCYADFTFSTIGTPAQPEKVNSIYYAADDPNTPKSYNSGIDSRVGTRVNDKLLIFQGPSTISWNGRMEYGAVEADPRFSPERIEQWLNADVHVKGRPEWVFVKVYSHGAQSMGVVLEHDMTMMLECLKKYCKERQLKLHFMSSREAYNVVKAAEDGMAGNPEDYRNYMIPPYRNMLEELPSPTRTANATAGY